MKSEDLWNWLYISTKIYSAMKNQNPLNVEILWCLRMVVWHSTWKLFEKLSLLFIKTFLDSKVATKFKKAGYAIIYGKASLFKKQLTYNLNSSLLATKFTKARYGVIYGKTSLLKKQLTYNLNSSPFYAIMSKCAWWLDSGMDKTTWLKQGTWTLNLRKCHRYCLTVKKNGDLHLIERKLLSWHWMSPMWTGTFLTCWMKNWFLINWYHHHISLKALDFILNVFTQCYNVKMILP